MTETVWYLSLSSKYHNWNRHAKIYENFSGQNMNNNSYDSQCRRTVQIQTENKTICGHDKNDSDPDRKYNSAKKENHKRKIICDSFYRCRTAKYVQIPGCKAVKIASKYGRHTHRALKNLRHVGGAFDSCTI